MIHIDHRSMRRAVEAYVDGEVRSPSRLTEVRAHLDECWGCSGDADTLRLVKRSLRRLRDHRPTELSVIRLRRWLGGVRW